MKRYSTTDQNGVGITNDDATSSSKGQVQLGGDLDGVDSTAASPILKNVRKLYNVLDAGAKRDVIVLNDVVTAAGSPIVTSASASFSSLDIGKILAIQQGVTLATQATSTLTSDTTNPGDGSLVTIGSLVYRFKNTMSQAFDIQIGMTAALTLFNLYQAINLTGTMGTTYYTGTTISPDVTASSYTATTFSLTGKALGALGNQVQTIAPVHLAFTGTYMTSGLNGVPTKAAILSVQSATQVTLNTNVGQTLAATNMVYGTDCASSTQALMTAIVAAGGGTMWYPEGSFITSSAVPLNTNVFISGAGKDLTTIYSNVSYDYVFKRTGTTPFSNFTVENMTINMNNIDHGGGIRAEYASNGLFNKLRFLNTANGWHLVVGVTSTTDANFRNFDIDVKNCLFDNITSTLEQLLFMNTYRGDVKNCRFTNQTVSNGPGIGFYQNCKDISVRYCRFVNIVGPAAYYSLSTNYITFQGCKFYGPGQGIQGANLADNGAFGYGQVFGLKVNHCFFTNCADALQLGATCGARVSDVNFDGNYLTGIRINQGNQGVSALSIRWRIAGCTFNHNNTIGNNDLIHPAILFEQIGGNMYGVITGCHFWNDESNRDQQYPIEFSGAHTWDCIDISHNYMPNYNGSNATIGFDSGAAIGPNVIVNDDYTGNPVTSVIGLTNPTSTKAYAIAMGVAL